MAVYGNRVVKVAPAKKVVKEAAPVKYNSVVFEEYKNYSAMLESCTSASDSIILEAQVKVLKESVIKDIGAKIKAIIDKILLFIDNAIDKLQAIMVKAVASHGVLKYWQSDPKISEKQALVFKKYVANSKNVDYFAFGDLTKQGDSKSSLMIPVKSFENILTSAAAYNLKPDPEEAINAINTKLDQPKVTNSITYNKDSSNVDDVINDINNNKTNIIEIVKGDRLLAATKVFKDYKHCASDAEKRILNTVEKSFETNFEGHHENTLSDTLNYVKKTMDLMHKAIDKMYYATVFQYNAILTLTSAGIRSKVEGDVEDGVNTVKGAPKKVANAVGNAAAKLKKPAKEEKK
jgi:hypothetical protein